MIAILGVLQIAALAWILFVGAGSASVAAAYPRRRTHLMDLAPDARARGALAWLVAPFVLATLLVAICFVPSLLAALGWGADHCLLHDDEHAHFCFVHAPPTAGSAAGWIILGVVVLAAVAVLTPRVRALLEARRAAKALAGAAQGTAGSFVLDCASPVALTVGFVRPRVLLSTGLLRALPEASQGIVLAHERAHAARRDNLWKWIAQVLAVVHGRRTAALLAEDHALACEQACDARAAGECGDAVAVAETILAVERLAASADAGQLASAFGGSADVAARVDALLAEPRPRPSARGALVPIAALVAVAALLSDPLHDAIESVLSLLAS